MTKGKGTRKSVENLQKEIQRLQHTVDVSNLLIWLMAKRLGYKHEYIAAGPGAALLLLRIPEIRYWIRLTIYSYLITSEVRPANQDSDRDLLQRFERWNTVDIDERDCFNAVFEALFGFVPFQEDRELEQAEADELDQLAEERRKTPTTVRYMGGEFPGLKS